MVVLGWVVDLRFRAAMSYRHRQAAMKQRYIL